ncbi:hypothetical protein [Vibrio vulnificus]|uniref:hypothetical protein n=1 Tax=Vibrio vulnificus TaxID=672 RepID=UPI003C12F8FD
MLVTMKITLTIEQKRELKFLHSTTRHGRGRDRIKAVVHVSNCWSAISNSAACFAFLSERLPSKVNISHPQGGMVLWLQVPGLNLNQFAALIEENRIDIRLGQLFSTLSLYNDCLRINIGFELTQEVQDELSLLAAAITQSC